MVVAGAHPVEESRVHLHAERLPALALHLQGKLDAAAVYLQAKAVLVGQ